MKPITFREANEVIARDQPPYLPLPCYLSRDETGWVISCWYLSLLERIRLLLTGKIWLSTLTFRQKLQPQRISLDHPFEEEENQ